MALYIFFADSYPEFPIKVASRDVPPKAAGRPQDIDELGKNLYVLVAGSAEQTIVDYAFFAAQSNEAL